MYPLALSLPRRRFLQVAALALPTGWVRADESAPPIPTFNQAMDDALRNAPLRLKFRGDTPAQLAEWQRTFAEELRRRIGPHSPPGDWRSSRRGEVDCGDHVREEWLLDADDVPSLPLYILRPKPATDERLPIILALHGHGRFGHDSVAGIDTTPQRAQAIQSANYDYGRQLVRQGYLVVAPCLTPFGPRITDSQRDAKTDQCAVAFVRLMLLGQTLIGANLRDVSWALSFASRRPDANPDRVACVGLSYGGRMTMLATALDARIKAAVISGALNVMQERATGGGYSCGAQVIPGLLEIGDTPEIGSLIAPRPCIWEMGSRDGLIVKGWAEEAQSRLRKAYAASGHPDRLQFHAFEGGHVWSGTTARPMLEEQLKRTAATSGSGR